MQFREIVYVLGSVAFVDKWLILSQLLCHQSPLGITDPFIPIHRGTNDVSLHDLSVPNSSEAGCGMNFPFLSKKTKVRVEFLRNLTLTPVFQAPVPFARLSPARP